ncbi:hypothetical protein F5B20DRAFT_556986 [Whalleya microplaca]|nr:hypothetical protein F5B20DRAFT_556986 [Whalleya microplaca]
MFTTLFSMVVTNNTTPQLCPGHLQPPAYIFHDQARPQLQAWRYEPQELLYCTVGSFFDVSVDGLSAIQLNAKREFLKVYKDHSRLYLAQLHSMDLRHLLFRLMRQADEFFFFGSLSPRIVRLDIAGTVESINALGTASEEVENGFPLSRITIATTRSSPVTLEVLIHTLLHEMVHAFLYSFICRQQTCEQSRLDAVGMDHGPTFRALHFAIMKCMSQWHPGLAAEFYSSTCGTYVDLPSFHQETRNTQAERTPLALGDSPSCNVLIGVDGTRVVIQSIKLREYVQAACFPEDYE